MLDIAYKHIPDADHVGNAQHRRHSEHDRHGERRCCRPQSTAFEPETEDAVEALVGHQEVAPRRIERVEMRLRLLLLDAMRTDRPADRRKLREQLEHAIASDRQHREIRTKVIRDDEKHAARVAREMDRITTLGALPVDELQSTARRVYPESAHFALVTVHAIEVRAVRRQRQLRRIDEVADELNALKPPARRFDRVDDDPNATRIALALGRARQVAALGDHDENLEADQIVAQLPASVARAWAGLQAVAQCAGLINRNLCAVHHGLPFGHFGGHQIGEQFRATVGLFQAERRQTGAPLSRIHKFVDLLIEAGHYRRRQGFKRVSTTNRSCERSLYLP